ncbi:hypothetical protein F5B22DRAFT_645703 [Xylaria bambusicola]|uniref:uncharacterized protein n=1 Tax=Xylaria bambusicola TaxID=326684 RepID=UPI00200799F9|nr:uncharacterized protein F5B22DRAFT_645703 [Xylaria bambusicola]KAI0517519.1 hypothetical protein F5B22DRAFT_645703 [Xylaria bambusicola]
MSAQPTQDSCGSWSCEDSDQQELSAIIASFKMDNYGVISLGKDGILRSLTAERDVIGAAPLRPSLIAALHARFPKEYAEKYLTAEWDGVDGFKTPESAWYNPDKSILPAPLSELKKKETIEELETLKKQESQTSGQQHEG